MITALQSAIYTRLSNQLTPTVYDHVPQNADGGDAAPFPYVVIDALRLQPNDTNDATAFTGSITIHSWSRYNGAKEVQELQASIYSALHQYNNSLTVSGYGVSSIYQEFCETIRENDTITRHGVQRFRVIIEQTS